MDLAQSRVELEVFWFGIRLRAPEPNPEPEPEQGSEYGLGHVEWTVLIQLMIHDAGVGLHMLMFDAVHDCSELWMITQDRH